MSENAAGKPWCYDTLLDSVRRAWDEHDKTCGSLPRMWFGRKGGVSCHSDFTSCDGCGAVFFWEGLTGDPDERRYFCECCRRPHGESGDQGKAG